MAHPAAWIALALIALLALVGAYDVYATFALPPGNTVSFHIQAWAQQFPALPLAVGVLLGHLFWPVLGPNRPDQPGV